MNTVLIAPLTSTIKNLPFRVKCYFHDHQGEIALDHIRSVDKSRLVKRLGAINEETAFELCRILDALFEY